MHHLRWRKAIVISVMVQIILLGSVGWIAARYVVPKDVEQYREIELTTEVEQAEQAKQVAAQQPVNKISTPGRPTPKATAANPKVVVSDELTPIVGNDVPMAKEIGAGGSGSEAGGTNGSGGETGATASSGTGTSTVKKQGGVIQPIVLHKVKPIYPESARNDSIEGTVVVKIQVLTNGRPGEISILSSSGNRDLDNAAIAAVEQFQFVPAKDRDTGNPIVRYCKLSVGFDLRS